MDNADRADAAYGVVLALTIAGVRSQKGKTIKARGSCHYCAEHVGFPNLFCDLDCREDWEREQKMSGIEGI